MRTLNQHLDSTSTSPISPTAVVAPLVATGVLMAAYLVLRPYGDVNGGATPVAAQAFASWQWIAAHLCGAASLASFGRFTLRLKELLPGLRTRIARTTGLLGSVAVLPYYGAEMFGLHALGRAALAGDPGVLRLVEQIRNQPVALATFGAGLILLAISGIAAALAWSAERGSVAAWPLGVLVALVLPQYYLPPVGRMAFGVAYALAAFSLAWGVLRSRR